MIWFKIKKHNNTSINGVNFGQKPRIEVVIEEEKPKFIAPKKVIGLRQQRKP